MALLLLLMLLVLLKCRVGTAGETRCHRFAKSGETWSNIETRMKQKILEISD